MAAKKNTGEMEVLQLIYYKDFPIYIRRFGSAYFLWDVIIDNKLYSSYIVITFKNKGKGKSLNQSGVNEVIKMCYAGACATVDNHLGIELTDDEKEKLKIFEDARVKIESQGEKSDA